MQHLMTGTRFRTAMGAAAGLTILSGLLMYAGVSGGFQLAWIASGTGLALTVGALAAILAAAGGGRGGGAGRRLEGLMLEVTAAGGRPTPAQAAELAALQRRGQSTMRAAALLGLVAVAAMAVARYV